MADPVVVSSRRIADATVMSVSVGDVTFTVTVTDADKADLAPGAGIERLVVESFRFLIEREPLGAIMRRFDVSVIHWYFPEYRDEIRRRLAGVADA